MFTNPNDSGPTTPPSVEVWTKQEVIAAIPIYELVHSVNGNIGDVVLAAGDIEAANGQTIQQIFDNIGNQVISEVVLKQTGANPVLMSVTSKFLDGTVATTIETLFGVSGHLEISYDSAVKTVLFNNEAVGLTLAKITGHFDIPEAGTLFVWSITPPVDLLLKDLVLIYNDIDMPTILGVVREINANNVVLDVVGSSYRYSAVQAFATRAAFPPPADAQARFFYVAIDTGIMYAFINGAYKALNDGGVLAFSDTTAFPIPGDYHFLYLDQSTNDMYAYLGSKYVLLNDGGIIEYSSVRPRPALGDPRFLYIDVEAGHIYAWIVDHYVMLNDGGIIFVDTYSDLPLQPNERFCYGTRDTGNIYAWLKGAWIQLNDGGVKTVSASSPRPAIGDSKFLYADVDTGLVYAWVVDKYVILNDGGIRLYAQRSDFPTPGDYRFLCIDQSSGDIYAYLGTQYVLLNDGGIRKVATPADLPANPNERFLYQTVSTNDIYAYLGGKYVLLNDGGIILVASYSDLPTQPNTRFIYGVLADNKLYARLNNDWVLLNKEGGLYVGVYPSYATLPADKGSVGDFAIVKHDETTADDSAAIYRVASIDTSTNVRTWIVDAPLRDIIGPKFLGYFYTESALIARISGNPGSVGIGDFALLLDNNQSSPAVPVLHEPPNAANRCWMYIVKTITPTVTLDNQIYLDSRGAFKGTFPTVSDLPQSIMFNGAGAKKGDWAIVNNNGSNRSAIYVIDDYNVLAPSVTWTSVFVFPQTEVYDALDGQGKTSEALSANQGYVLDQKIQALESDIHVRGIVLNAFTPQGNFYAVETAIPDIGPFYAIQVPSVFVGVGGTGYQVDDILTVQTDDDLKPTVHVDAVDGSGVITALTLATNGYNSTNITSAPMTGGTGSGATLGFTMAATPKNGFGYAVGDALILSNPDSKIDAIVVINAVNINGGVSTLSISKKGSFENAPSSFATSGGTGYGCTLMVTTSLEPNSTLDDIVSPVKNDVGIVLEDEIHAGQAWQWIFADYNGDGVYNWVPLAPHNVNRDFFVNPIQEGEIAPGAVQPGNIGFDLMQEYTYVVRNNQDLNDWCDNKAGNNYSVVLIAPTSGAVVTASVGKYLDTNLTKTRIIRGAVQDPTVPNNTRPTLEFTDPTPYYTSTDGNGASSIIRNSADSLLTLMENIRVLVHVSAAWSSAKNHLTVLHTGAADCTIQNCTFSVFIANNATFHRGPNDTTSYCGVRSFDGKIYNVDIEMKQEYNTAAPTTTDNFSVILYGFVDCSKVLSSNFRVLTSTDPVDNARTNGNAIGFFRCNDLVGCKASIYLNRTFFEDNTNVGSFFESCGFVFCQNTTLCEARIHIAYIVQKQSSVAGDFDIMGFYVCSYQSNNTAIVGYIAKDSGVPIAQVILRPFIGVLAGHGTYEATRMVSDCRAAIFADCVVTAYCVWFGLIGLLNHCMAQNGVLTGTAGTATIPFQQCSIDFAHATAGTISTSGGGTTAAGMAANGFNFYVN
jgi:hypothetical protein